MTPSMISMAAHSNRRSSRIRSGYSPLPVAFLLIPRSAFDPYDDQQEAGGGLQMPKAAQRHELEGCDEIVKRDEPLASYTYLKVGGPAEMLVQPRTREELAGVIQQCLGQNIPFRVLGGGCNILVRDEGIRGIVLRLSEPAFT